MDARVAAPSSSSYAVLALLTGSFLWGLTWLPLKYFAGFGVHGLTMTLAAHGSVGALALPWLFLQRAAWREHRAGLLLLSLFGGLSNLAFATAIAQGQVLRVMVLFYLLPAWGVVGGWLFLGERVDLWRKLSVACALLGALSTLGGLAVFEQAPSRIDALAVLSGLALAANNIQFRRLSTVASPFKIGAMFAGCIIWVVPLLLFGVQELPVAVPARIWWQASAFGLVWLLAATTFTLWGVARMEAGKSSVLIIMELVTAVGSAALLAKKALTPREALGTALIMAAAVLVTRRPAAEHRTTASPH